jgi:hypothetical protein
MAAVLDDLDVPAVGLVALGHVLGEGTVGVAVNGDVVVIVDADEVAELEVAGQGRGLGRDTLHQAAIAEEAVGVVVTQGEAGLVEGGGGVGLGHGQTDGIGDTLTQGAGGDLDTGSIVGLGVTRSLAVDGLWEMLC